MVHYDLGTYFSRPICTILIIAGTLTLAAGVIEPSQHPNRFCKKASPQKGRARPKIPA